MEIENIFRERFRFFKIVGLEELFAFSDNDFNKFDVNLCDDFRVFTSKNELFKYASVYKRNQKCDKLFYAEFETDKDYYINLNQYIEANNYIVLSKGKINELNSHIVHTSNESKIFLYQIFEYKEEPIEIPLWVVWSLMGYSVDFSDSYFEYVLSHQRPYKRGGMNLFIADLYNRKYMEELGKIVVYNQEPIFYEDVLSAVLDNYDKKYRFGFEKLHNMGILPIAKGERYVSKFGVNIKESRQPIENEYISCFKESIDDLYQWKYGKRALRCYNDPFFRDQDDGQTLEEFKYKEVRYRCFVALFEMDFMLKLSKTKKEKNQGDVGGLYINCIDTVLNRYAHNGKSVFQKVDDLNDYYKMSNKFETEVYERWGNTDAYCEHERKTKNYTKEKWAEINDGLMSIFAEFAECKNNGHDVNSPEVQSLVAKLQEYITQNYYTCTNEILAGLGKMYVADERFKKNIDKYGEGTAEFVAESIEIYVEKK